jgi:hypothetical protein
MRMARVKVTLPDQLLNHAEDAGLNISQLAARAISDELNRRSKMVEFDAYLAEMDAEFGPLDPKAMAEAEEWADRVLGPKITKGGGSAKRSSDSHP